MKRPPQRSFEAPSEKRVTAGAPGGTSIKTKESLGTDSQPVGQMRLKPASPLLKVPSVPSAGLSATGAPAETCGSGAGSRLPQHPHPAMAPAATAASTPPSNPPGILPAADRAVDRWTRDPNIAALISITADLPEFFSMP